MDTLKDVIKGLPAAGRRSYTPEEYEAAKKAVYARTYTGICKPDCPECGGVGWLRVAPDASIHDPLFGQVRMCTRVDVAKIYQGLGLDEAEIRGLSWKAVKGVTNEGAAAAAVKDTLERGYGWVTLYGDYGKAKSLILRVAIAECLRANRLSAFVEMAALLADLRSAFDAQNPNAEAERRLDRWREIPILAVDEVDRVNRTEWAKEKEFELLNYRYQMAIRGKSVTIFASNQSPEEIGGALGDRMRDGRFSVVHIEGASNRPNITRQAY